MILEVPSNPSHSAIPLKIMLPLIGHLITHQSVAQIHSYHLMIEVFAPEIIHAWQSELGTRNSREFS